MSFRTRLGWWVGLLSLSCNYYAFAPAPTPPVTSKGQHSTDENVLRTLADTFYAAWAGQDLHGYLRLWGAQAPDLEANKKAATELFVSGVKIALNSFAVIRVGLVGDKAWVRVELDALVIDVQTGKEARRAGP